MRGISLDQIMATTKISRRLLQALEDEQFELLPGGIFNKSYVRAYAKCVGMDEEEAVAEYLEAAKEPLPDTRVIAHQHESIHSDRRLESPRFPLVPVLVLVAVVAGGIGAWKLIRGRQSDRQMPQPQATVSSAAPTVDSGASAHNRAEPESAKPTSPVSSTTPGAASAQAPATMQKDVEGAFTSYTSASSPFQLTVRAKDRAWISIKSDGKSVVRGILKPAEVKTIRAADQVIFYTGNAGAVDLAFDGKSIPLTGGQNDTRTLVFNAPKTTQTARAPAP
jgi:cytoskeleton protein RodZ